jgi:uncharacterized LabA/DUF88 family protein
MSQTQETNLALFLDFDNIALGVRDARQRFDIQLLLQRLLEKGKIIVKRAYADWGHHKEYMEPLHEAGIELIEIPARRMTGKNSADIRLVVDAMDLCYSKHHIGNFVIVSGDSDFSPLVAKLRENDKIVTGVGVRNSTSKLLVSNCDEFIFYDDLFKANVDRSRRAVENVPADKRKLFDFLLVTTQRLLQESRGVLYSSLIKDTMKRKRPDFNEGSYGYSTFGDLLEDAQRHGLLEVKRDERAGGTWVVYGISQAPQQPVSGSLSAAGQQQQSSRRSGRRGGRRRGNGRRATERGAEARENGRAADSATVPAAGEGTPAEPGGARPDPEAPTAQAAPPSSRQETAVSPAAVGTPREHDRPGGSLAGEAATPDPAQTAPRDDPGAQGMTGQPEKARKAEKAEKTAKKTTRKKTAKKTTKKATGKAAKKTTKKAGRRKKTAKKTAGAAEDKPRGGVDSSSGEAK